MSRQLHFAPPTPPPALRAARPLPPGRFLVVISVRGWVNQRALMRLESLDELKKSNYLIGNRTRDLSACSRVPQPTTLPRAPGQQQASTQFHCWNTAEVHQTIREPSIQVQELVLFLQAEKPWHCNTDGMEPALPWNDWKIKYFSNKVSVEDEVRGRNVGQPTEQPRCSVNERRELEVHWLQWLCSDEWDDGVSVELSHMSYMYKSSTCILSVNIYRVVISQHKITNLTIPKVRQAVRRPVVTGRCVATPSWLSGASLAKTETV
jgi:hypothetical protein